MNVINYYDPNAVHVKSNNAICTSAAILIETSLTMGTLASVIVMVGGVGIQCNARELFVYAWKCLNCLTEPVSIVRHIDNLLQNSKSIVCDMRYNTLYFVY